MKIKKHTNGNVILIDDAGKEINRVPSDWLLGRDLKNAPMYFFASPNGSNGGGVVIEHAKVTHLIKGTTETAWSGTADQLFTELSDNFFIKANSGAGGPVSADNVTETANRVFSSPAKEAATNNKIGTDAMDLLVGKKVVLMCDSFDVFNSFNYKLAAMGMVVIKSSVSGSQIIGGAAPMIGRIDAALNLDPDIFAFNPGSNDWLNNVTLGTINDAPGTATFYGALKTIMAKAVAKNPPCLVIPINMCPRGTRADYAAQELYANAVIEVSKMYAVKTWDLFHEGGITYENLGVKTFDSVHAAGGYGLDELSSQFASFLTKQYGFKYNKAPQIVYQKSFTNLTDWVSTNQTIVTDGGIQKVVFTQQGEIQKNLSSYLTQGDMVRITLTDVRVQAGKGHVFFSGVDRIFNLANGSKITLIAPYASSGSPTIYMGANAGGYVFIGGITIEKL